MREDFSQGLADDICVLHDELRFAMSVMILSIQMKATIFEQIKKIIET
jgi:hypothetical protein